MSDAHLHIAIDGPAAGGKSTVGRRLARRLALRYFDTGAMYRALAYVARRDGIAPADAASLCEEVRRIRVDLESDAPLGFRIFANGAELDEETLHSEAVTSIVSEIAAHAGVREKMVAAQRAIADKHDIVMAGRDIGTVVLPNAQVKVFLTASVAARVERRRVQLEHAGVRARQLAREIEERDRLDRDRAVAPLVPASDAYIIDSSAMSADQVVDAIADIVERTAQRR